LILVPPLFYLKFLDRIRRLRCRNFKQAALAFVFSGDPVILTFAKLAAEKASEC